MWQFVSRGFALHHKTIDPLPPGCTNALCQQALAFPPLPAGTIVLAQQSAINRAGLGAAFHSSLIMLDNTPPTHPALHGCTPGGRTAYGDGLYYQTSEEGLELCWEGPGFVDVESQVHTLEWQLARYVPGASVAWSTLTPTQVRQSAIEHQP